MYTILEIIITREEWKFIGITLNFRVYINDLFYV